MIKAVRSDHGSFNSVYLKEGFNVILAERTKISTDKDSRNGLGKTTFVDIIHFCLGSSPKANEGLRVRELENWTFILDIVLNGKDMTISRNTSDLTRVRLEGDFSDWPIKPSYDKKEKAYTMKIKEWNMLLGNLIFDLGIEKPDNKYLPSFRSMISYFLRRDIGSFIDPFKHYSQQKEWDIQVNNSYLLGLNWEYAGEFQSIKDKVKTLDILKTAANQGLLTDFTGTHGELEAERIRLQIEFNKLEEQLKTFKVHPQYYIIQEDADKLTEQIHQLLNKQNISRNILSKYKESVIEENEVSIDKIKQVYNEAGTIFPDSVIKRLDDLMEFHKKVVANRKSYLKDEIDKISRDIAHQQQQIEGLSDKKADLLNILATHGALEEYSRLQERASILKQQLEEINNRIDNLIKFEEGRSSLKIEKEELLQKTRKDLNERKEQIKNVISLFNKNSEYLYSEPGILSIDVTDDGGILGFRF